MRSVFSAIVIIGALTGCISAAQKQAAAKMQAARSQCEAIHADKYVPMADCMTQAENSLVRSGYPYPDLLNANQAHRRMVAEKIDRGELTASEGKFQSAQFVAQTESEATRRRQGQQAVNAAQSQAWSGVAIAGAAMMQANQPTPTYVVQAPPIPRPITCRTFYGTTTCQ